jgi:hypothetical protein
VFSDKINWTDILQCSGNGEKGTEQNTLGLYDVLSQNKNTTEKNNQVMSFAENIAIYMRIT